MPRTLSSAAKSAIFAQQTDEVFIALLELNHPEFAGILRFAANDQDVYRGGQRYFAFPFEIMLPNDDDDAPPKVSLRIDNVDRRIIEEVRNVPGDPIAVDLFIVTATSPDTIEAGPYTFSLREVSYSAATIEGTLTYEDVLSEPFPSGSFTPSRFPGLF